MLSSDQFYMKLLKEGKAKITAKIYETTLVTFKAKGYDYSFKSICSWKEYLLNNFKPNTVNLRIQAMNKFLKFNNISFKIKPLNIQPQQFVENQLTTEQYKKLIRGLRKNKEYKWYVIIRILATTGLRISEFMQVRLEDIRKGYIDIIGKGTKARRVWFPKSLQKDILEIYKEDGYIVDFSDTYIRYKFKQIALKYNIPPEVMHPHEFRVMNLELSLLEMFMLKQKI